MTSAPGRSLRPDLFANPSPSPPSRPHQPVRSFQGHHHHQPPRLDQPHTNAPTQQQLKQLQQRRSSSTDWQQERSVDSSWRAIFDAALVKAQQAVQHDELGETVMAIDLYEQAVADLGRVIPMCGIEKKKKSMIAIQTIYQDRLSQLNASISAKATETLLDLLPEQPEALEPYYTFTDGRGVAYGHEDQYTAQGNFQEHNLYEQSRQRYAPQEPFQSPRPLISHHTHSDGSDRGSKIIGKKRSKTQPSEPHPPDFLLANYGYSNNNDNGIGRYGNGSSNGIGNGSDHSNGNYIRGEYGISGNGGYISPPYSAPASSPSPPPLLVSPIFMTHKPEITPPESQAAEQQKPSSSSSKSSRWRPFGKKKSKSFSAGETSTSVPFQHPSGSEAPSVPELPSDIPRPVFLPSNIVDPVDWDDLYSQPFQGQQPQQPQQQPGWFMDQRESPIPLDEHEQLTRYYDDDENGDVDPHYIADAKGRAHAFEGTNASKVKVLPAAVPTENESTFKRPTLTHNTSSYSYDQPFPSAFVSDGYSQGSSESVGYASQEPSSNVPDERDYPLSYPEGEYHDPHQLQYTSVGWQRSSHSVDPSMTKPASAFENYQMDQHPSGGTETETAESEKPKQKTKWFGKKKKNKKDEPVETYDNVAKLMDQAMFGGGAAKPRKKNKDKEAEMVIQRSMQRPRQKSLSVVDDNGSLDDQIPPNSLPMILPRKDSRTDFDSQTTYDSHGSSLDARQRASSQLRYDDLATSMAEQHLLAQETVEIYSSTPYTRQATHTPKALAPINHATGKAYMLPGKRQQQDDGTLESIESPLSVTPESVIIPKDEDARYGGFDPAKKSKSQPYNMFKLNEDGRKQSLNLDNMPISPTFSQIGTGEDIKSVLSDNTRKSSIHSSELKPLAPVALAKDRKKRVSDGYIPYEYQEEVEGPLMERVEVPENREIVGFVLPVEEIVDYDLEGTDETALDNWDSWVNQLEFFEKVLSDKGLKKKNSKRAKKLKKEKEKEMAEEQLAASRASTSSSPFSSLKANRSSIFSSSTSRPSTIIAQGTNADRPTTVSEDLSSRHSFHSTRSSAVLGQDIAVQQLSVQQGKKRWWNPRRKETTSVYSSTGSFAVSEQDQEVYLSTLLHNSHEIQIQQQQQQQQQHLEQPQHSLQDIQGDKDVASQVTSQEHEGAPNDISECSQTILSLQRLEPMLALASPLVVTAPEVVPAEKIATVQHQQPVTEEEVVVAPIEPKIKAPKSNKVKLQPISTPVAKILQIEDPEELWLYVQQAKTYATTKMNKGDKRSAAIALKRAQALEARWQEIMLELASSGEDEDELLDDDDDDDEEDDDEEDDDDEGKEVKKETHSEPAPTAKATSVPAIVPTQKLRLSTNKATEAPSDVLVTPTVLSPQDRASEYEDDNDDDDDLDEERARRRMHMRKIQSRSETALDMYSKYKVSNKSALPSQSSLATSTEDATAEVDESGAGDAEEKGAIGADDERLGADATLEQLLATTNIRHLQFYIQRLKTDTVTKARNGNKFAALEGMKNVKTLQRRLTELEDGGKTELEVDQ
ncbi:hypothetical protein BGZ99_007968 [Dissophora globulifera]|uniref:MIT domain-containing protein n=1 Tax=Dissophora globulifera TaxID=979702 RepID=A0A9P6RYX7_9FUNG|nr:hypothetical protein BGZ99_007968 [Dissophora globulifera]